MEKLVVLYPPQPDPKSFKDHYQNIHLPLVRRLPGVQAMRHSFNVGVIAGNASFFCIFEADFADEKALGAAMESPEGRAVSQDVVNFAQVPPTILRYTTEPDSRGRVGQ